MKWVFLCPLSQLTADFPLQAQAEGLSFALFKIGERVCVTQDECTHGPGILSEGYFDGEEVECPFHQGRFNVTSGAPTAPPCIEALATWEPVIRDGGVWIDVEAPRRL